MISTDIKRANKHNYTTHSFLFIGAGIVSSYYNSLNSHRMKKTSTIFNKLPHTGKGFSNILFIKPLAADIPHNDCIHTAIIRITAKMHTKLSSGQSLSNWQEEMCQLYRKYIIE
jgi:hypothetical protein